MLIIAYPRDPDPVFSLFTAQVQGPTTFDPAITGASGAYANTLNWDFGDSTTAQGGTQSKTYAGSGPFSVALTSPDAIIENRIDLRNDNILSIDLSDNDKIQSLSLRDNTLLTSVVYPASLSECFSIDFRNVDALLSLPNLTTAPALTSIRIGDPAAAQADIDAMFAQIGSTPLLATLSVTNSNATAFNAALAQGTLTTIELTNTSNLSSVTGLSGVVGPCYLDLSNCPCGATLSTTGGVFSQIRLSNVGLADGYSFADQSQCTLIVAKGNTGLLSTTLPTTSIVQTIDLDGCPLSTSGLDISNQSSLSSLSVPNGGMNNTQLDALILQLETLAIAGATGGTMNYSNNNGSANASDDNVRSDAAAQALADLLNVTITNSTGPFTPTTSHGWTRNGSGY